MTVQRLRNPFTEENLDLVIKDPKMHYHALTTLSMPFELEYIMVMYRRMMLGCMVDPQASILAVILTAIEEAILRSTMVYRDNFFNWLQGRPELTGAELEHQVSPFCYLQQNEAKGRS